MNANFRLYFAARIVSQLGDQLYVFAVSWFVLDLTKSSFHMAALLAVNALAVMAAAPAGGLVADRVSRKTVMVVTDLLQGAVLLALFALQQAHLLSLGALYGGTILLGLASGMFSPAAGAIIPGIVEAERVPSAVAAGQGAANFCTIAGMLLGGGLYTLVGISGILALNAVSNLAAAGLESRIRVRGSAEAAAPAMAAAPVTAVRDALQRVRADRTVFSLLLINTAFTLVVLPIGMVYMPYFFNVLLGSTPAQSAFPQASIWAGIILGSAAAARLMRRHRPERLMAAALFVLAIHTLLMVALSSGRTGLGTAALSAACSGANAVAGAAAAFFIVPLYSLFHARAPDEIRGRFWGLEGALRTAAMCAGYFLAGALAQRLGITAIFAGSGLVLAALGAAVTRVGARCAATDGKTVVAR